MDAIEVLLLILIAGVAGAMARLLTGVGRGGCLVSVALGFAGALIGTWLSRWLEVPELFPVRIDDVTFPVVWAVVGATLFALLVGIFTRRKSG